MHFNYTASYQNDERERLQMLFNQYFLSNDKSGLRKQYKILRRLELNHNVDYDNEIIDISSITENISVACDILLSDTGVSVIYCGNKTSHAVCNKRYFIKALLNLISNAYLYGCENLITIKVIEMADFIRVEVLNGGVFINSNTGKGLNFVQKVCAHSNGKFFIEQTTTSTRAVMIFEKSRDYKELNHIDFYSLINDRLSPVYIELFGMEYH